MKAPYLHKLLEGLHKLFEGDARAEVRTVAGFVVEARAEIALLEARSELLDATHLTLDEQTRTIRRLLHESRELHAAARTAGDR